MRQPPHLSALAEFSRGGVFDVKHEPTQAETIKAISARWDENTDQFGTFDRAVRHSLTISKEAVLLERSRIEEGTRLKRLRAKRRTKKPSA